MTSTATARPALYTIPEVVTIARSNESTVRHWIAVKKLRAVRPGRRVLVPRADLARFLGVTPDELPTL